MKAKKVYEMIDPYTSEDANMDLDVSYKKKLIEDWFQETDPDIEYHLDKDLNITISEAVYLGYSSIEYLPDNLTVKADMDISRNKIKKLPRNLTVEGFFDIRGTSITELPKDLVVGGDMDISYSSIKEIPEYLNIKGKIYVTDTQFSEFNIPDKFIGRFIIEQ